MTIINKYSFVFLVVFFLGSISFAQSLEELIPEVKVLESNNPSKGFVYLSALYTISTGENPFLAVLDNYGTTVFYRETEPAALSFSKTLDGRMAYFSGYPRKLFFLNEYLKITDSLGISGEKIILDTHDYSITEEGHTILLAYSQRLVDMRSIVNGGKEFATVKDLIIQEYDKEKNLIFNWNSADHFQITDANEASIYIDFTASVIDYVHVNGVFVDTDTSLLISCRHMDEITKIDRRSGEIIWRFGGKNNQFSFINDPIGFSHQHSINKLKNGNILLFDNGNLHENEVSSIVEYQLDEQEKTATLIKRIYHEPKVFSNFLGYTQQTKSGSYIAGWGHRKPSFSEYNSEGILILELDFSDHSFSNSTFKGDWKQSVFGFSEDSLLFLAQNDNSFVRETILVSNNTDENIVLSSYSSHYEVFELDQSFPVSIASNSSITIDVVFYPNRIVSGYANDIITLNSDSEHERITDQLYLEGYKPDFVSPLAVIVPEGNSISVDTSVIINFSEPVRYLNDEYLSSESVKSLLVFRKDGAGGENVPYSAIVNTSKTKIELVPKIVLEENQKYFVSLDPFLEDYNNNAITYTQVEFSTGMISGISDLNVNPLKVYPNPSSGDVFIVLQDKKPFDIRIFNINGALVYSDLRNLSFPHIVHKGTLPKGVYLIEIKNGKEEFRRKLILY